MKYNIIILVILLFYLLSFNITCYSPIIFVRYMKKVAPPGKKRLSKLDETFDYEDIYIKTKDGYTINCWLLYPVGYKPKLPAKHPKHKPGHKHRNIHRNSTLSKQINSWFFNPNLVSSNKYPVSYFDNTVLSRLSNELLHKILHCKWQNQILLQRNPNVTEKFIIKKESLFSNPSILYNDPAINVPHDWKSRIGIANLRHYDKNIRPLPVPHRKPMPKTTLNKNKKKKKVNKVIIVLHGNAGNIGSSRFYVHRFRLMGYFVFLVEYRGYGNSTGTPSEIGLYWDAEAAYDWIYKNVLFEKGNIAIVGRSLGCAVALELALRRNCKAVILDSPFTSIKGMIQTLAKSAVGIKEDSFFPIPLYLLSSSGFDNERKIAKLTSPIKIIHSSDDSIAPLWMAKKLYQLANQSKSLSILQGGEHLSTCCNYYKIVNQFLTKHME